MYICIFIYIPQSQSKHKCTCSPRRALPCDMRPRGASTQCRAQVSQNAAPRASRSHARTLVRKLCGRHFIYIKSPQSQEQAQVYPSASPCDMRPRGASAQRRAQVSENAAPRHSLQRLAAATPGHLCGNFAGDNLYRVNPRKAKSRHKCTGATSGTSARDRRAATFPTTPGRGDAGTLARKL
jgi:hypothetical protein